ncbi:hypothetical protein ACQRWP_12775 [Micromonospora trifolii]|uniref:hypothetical protein n=1 Tax=Micromonospora trifolii TaxID=2911208 RepID=UPI003D2EFFA5
MSVAPEVSAAFISCPWMFRLLGGAVPGDLTGLPACRLAILPGTTHTSIRGVPTGWPR